MGPYVVLDASVAGAWSFAETYSSEAQVVLEAVLHNRVEALAPDRFAEELLRICQKKTLSPPVGASIHAGDSWSRFVDVVSLPILLLPSAELHERAWELAFLAGLTTHDALYLAAAEAWRAELWTLDCRLCSPAASAYAGVQDLRSVRFPY